MKPKPTIMVIICAAGIFALERAPAQGVITFLDNTSQPIAGNNGLGNTTFDPRIDVEFQTGTNAAGYTLNSVSFLMANASTAPSPTAFEIDVLAADDSTEMFLPFSVSSNPITAGLYTYSVPSVLLAANTDYWLSCHNPGSGTYEWDYADNTTATTVGGWSITGNIGPAGTSASGIPMFAISATAVPEPSSLAMLAMGTILVLGGAKLRRR
jgi:hypothetical protein